MKGKAFVAGVLTIVSGVFGFLWPFSAWLSLRLFEFSMFSQTGDTPPQALLEAMGAFYTAYGIAGALLGVFAIAGGVLALKRRRWGWALAGTVAGVIVFFPAGIPAVVLLSMGRDEFKTREAQLVQPGVAIPDPDAEVRSQGHESPRTERLKEGAMQNKAQVGGVLTVISGVFGVLETFFVAMAALLVGVVATSSDFGAPQETFDPFTIVMVMYGVGALFFLAMGILGIVGGIYALKRRHWGLALAGAICGILTFLPLGIIATVFTAQAQKEFPGRLAEQASASGAQATVA